MHESDPKYFAAAGHSWDDSVEGFERRDGTDSLLVVGHHIDALLHKCPADKPERKVLEARRVKVEQAV